MLLHFATTNANKVQGPATALLPFGIQVVQYRLDIPEVQAETAAEVAADKVLYAYRKLGGSVMVIDSAFHIPALGGESGFPGPNVKWIIKQIGPEGFLRLMSHLPEPADRVCWFEDSLACFRHGDITPKVFTRRIMGMLAPEVRGGSMSAAKSPLWTLFIPQGHVQTLAEMPSSIFAAHRAEVKGFYEDFARWFMS